MLSIKYSNSLGNKWTSTHYLDILRLKVLNSREILEVESITVDNDELTHVKHSFGTFNGVWNMSIPWNFNSLKQTWYGDTARTILAYL